MRLCAAAEPRWYHEGSFVLVRRSLSFVRTECVRDGRDGKDGRDGRGLDRDSLLPLPPIPPIRPYTEASDPFTPHKSTGRRGRGTGGVKTNDVTGEIAGSEVSLRMEFGRPARGTRLAEVERMTTALARIGVYSIPNGPLAVILADLSTGEMKPEARDERVLTAPLEVHVQMDRLDEVVPVVREVARGAGTAISWSMTVRLRDGAMPDLARLERLGIQPRPNGKVNLGMGRPLAEEAR